MKNKSSFVRKHGFGVVGMLLLGVLGMGLFSAPAEAFSLPELPPILKIVLKKIPKIPVSPVDVVIIAISVALPYLMEPATGESSSDS